MAITAVATANTSIGPAQFADMAQALAPRFLVDSPNDFRPSWTSGAVYVQPGAATVAGTRVRSSAVESVTVPAPTSGTREYALVLRVDWSKGYADSASLVRLGGGTGPVPVNGTSSPVAASINRIPGVMYDALVARIVRTRTGATVVDYRPWGGDGGPIRVTAGAMDAPQMLDMRQGTFISTDRGEMTKRLDDDGVWRNVLTESNPWRVWTPTFRYYRDGVPNGVDGGSVVGMGNGGTASARYRVVDGMLDGYVFWEPGPTGATLGQGPVTVDLPLPCANWQRDTWSQGHFFNFGYGGDGAYDWPAQLLVKNGWTRGMIWVPGFKDDARLVPYRAADNSGNPGTGAPFIAGGFTVGTFTFHVNYPVDV